MKCHEAKRRLDPFMDGELTVPENLELLGHLNLCRACQSVFEGEKALRGALKERHGAVTAPAGLADRLVAALDAGSGVRAFPVGRRWALAAAAGFLVLVGLSMLGSSSGSFTVLAAELSRRHAAPYRCGEETSDGRCVCRGCCGDTAKSLGEFFRRRGRPDYCAHPELEAMLGYEVQGCSAWTFQGDLACGSSWKAPDGSTVTHALVKTRLAAEGRPRRIRAGARHVLLEPKGPSEACVFVFDTEAELRRFCAQTGLAVPREE